MVSGIHDSNAKHKRNLQTRVNYQRIPKQFQTCIKRILGSEEDPVVVQNVFAQNVSILLNGGSI